jgi:putative endonuclease
VQKVLPHQKREVGYFQENKVFLKCLEYGWLCLDKNFYSSFGEIDLIFWDPKKYQIVFVEVRSSTKKSGYLRYSIGRFKQTRLIKTAQYYLWKNKLTGFGFRFDIFWIEDNQIEHWRNVELSIN